MAQLQQARTRKGLADARRDGFDVTCVIGHVDIDGDGPHTPGQAAFLLIAERDTPGTYTFPMPNGATCRVSVDHDYPEGYRE